MSKARPQPSFAAETPNPDEAVILPIPAPLTTAQRAATLQLVNAVLALLVFLLNMPQTAQGQEATVGTGEAEAAVTTLTPFAAIGRNGTYWAADSFEFRPGLAPTFGALLRRELSGRTALEVLGGFSPTDYSIDFPGDEVRGTGSIDLYRLLAGVVRRTRPEVDGYFTAGAGGVYYNPRERVPAPFNPEEQDTVVFVTDDPAQFIPSAYVGAGLDLSAEAHTARFDLRLLASHALQDVAGPGAIALASRFTFEVLFSVGYVIGL